MSQQQPPTHQRRAALRNLIIGSFCVLLELIRILVVAVGIGFLFWWIAQEPSLTIIASLIFTYYWYKKGGVHTGWNPYASRVLASRKLAGIAGALGFYLLELIRIVGMGLFIAIAIQSVIIATIVVTYYWYRQHGQFNGWYDMGLRFLSRGRISFGK